MPVSDPVDVIAREAAIRFGRELRLAALGLPQRELARRAGISQSHVSRIMRGVSQPDLELISRLVHAAGHRFWFKLMPGDGIRLRDSGQLEVAETIRTVASPTRRFRLEVPIGSSGDLRAADLVADGIGETTMFEIERGLFDFQAQFRAAQLKRASFAQLLRRPVNLILAVPDTMRNRKILAPHAPLIASALPMPSGRIWVALRQGRAIGGDGLLWVRSRRRAH